MESKYVWMNGKIVPWQDATIHVASHALHYGSGVFEGIRAYATSRGPGVFRLDEHMARLAASGEFYDMTLPYTQKELKDATWALIAANEYDSCYIRPIAFRGLGQLGVYPRNCPVDVSILAWKWGAYLGEDGLQNGIRATISPIRRIADTMLPARAKATGQYLNSILAKMDAHDRGFEEAIMLNENDTIAEGSGENIFVVKDGNIITPRVTDSILQGITRMTVIEMCEHFGLPLKEKAITVEDLHTADEIFVTGTAAEITPIKEVDGHVIGKPGPVTKKLQEMFFKTVGGEDTPWSHYMSYS